METTRRLIRDTPRWQSRSGGSAGVGPRPDPLHPPPHVVLGEQLIERIDALTDRLDQLERKLAVLWREDRDQREAGGGRNGGEPGAY
jgi:hypothetical protein